MQENPDSKVELIDQSGSDSMERLIDHMHLNSTVVSKNLMHQDLVPMIETKAIVNIKIQIIRKKLKNQVKIKVIRKIRMIIAMKKMMRMIKKTRRKIEMMIIKVKTMKITITSAKPLIDLTKTYNHIFEFKFFIH